MTKDEEVRAVVAELESRLAELRQVTDALNKVLEHVPPGGGPQQKEPAA